MITMISQWLLRRREERRKTEFACGYGWAWSEHMLNGGHVDDIEAMLWCRDQFDLGAMQALRDIESLSPRHGKAPS